MANLNSDKPTSVAYSQGITLLIFVSALLGMFIMPMEGFGPSEYLAALETNQFIAGLIFYVTILGTVALGLAYIIQEIERTREACLDKLFDMDEKLGKLVENKK